jgi:L-iditol 2-dehydrogenase
MEMENKIINLTKNGKFEVSKRKLPILKKNKIRIKIKAVGVCASDIPRAHENGAYNYPLVMGHEMSGEICESKIKNFRQGDRAVIFPLIPCKRCNFCKTKNYNHCENYSYYGSRQDGGYAEFIDVYPWNILKVHKKINFLDSFALEPSAVALNTIKTLFTKKPKKNEKILVLGSGFIGLLIINLLKIKYKKLNLTVVDRNDHKLNMVPNIFKRFNLKRNHSNITKLYNEFDYIIETTGNNELISEIFRFAKNKSSLIFMGNINDDVSFKKKEINMILRKELKLYGVWNSNYKNPKQNDWTEVIRYIKRGFRPSKYISHIIKLDKIPFFIKKIYLSRKKSQRFKFLKIVALND